MSKNKVRKNKSNKNRKSNSIPIHKGSATLTHPLGVKILKARKSFTTIFEMFSIVTKWDKKLYLDKIRLGFSPIMLIPMLVSWIEIPLHRLGAAPHVLQSTFPIILKSVELCNAVMYWLQTSGFIIYLNLLFSLKFIQLLFKQDTINKQLQENMTPWVIFKMLFALVSLYSATQYHPGILGSILAWGTILLIVTTIPYLFKLRHNQKLHGSFNPDLMLKRELRREKKRK